MARRFRWWMVPAFGLPILGGGLAIGLKRPPEVITPVAPASEVVAPAVPVVPVTEPVTTTAPTTSTPTTITVDCDEENERLCPDYYRDGKLITSKTGLNPEYNCAENASQAGVANPSCASGKLEGLSCLYHHKAERSESCITVTADLDDINARFKVECANKYCGGIGFVAGGEPCVDHVKSLGAAITPECAAVLAEHEAAKR